MQATRHPGLVAVVVAAILLTHAALVIWLVSHWSPNIDEPAHLAAGMAAWQHGSFEFYCVNPPLMRAAATFPILFMSPEKQWGDFRMAGVDRPEFVLGEQFVESHPDRWRDFLIAARLAILPFAIIGGLFCYAWATELFGRKAGFLALALWCFCPNILAWSSVVCTDGVAAAMGVGAGYTFWRWLKTPNWPRALAAGSMLGLAQLAKMTWLPLFLLWPALWALFARKEREQFPRKQQVIELFGIVFLGWYVLNLGYAFDGTFTRLGEFQFHSSVLAGTNEPLIDKPGGNRFADSLLGKLPIPLPKHYVRGLDFQKADFEKKQPSYLFGKWSDRGWWHYYLVGLALKVPLGTWALAILAAAFSLPSLRRGRQDVIVASSARGICMASLMDQVVLLSPALMVLILVSSQDGFSRHFRYVLPALPFAYIWISKAAGWLRRGGLLPSAVVASCLAWTVGSSLAVFPHSMSYFNEIAGGPLNGHRYMLHSSFSWSQDDLYVKKWLESHPEVDAPYMHLERSVSLERLGLRGRGAPPKSIATMTNCDDPAGAGLGPIPGWHIISMQHIHEPDGGYLYFLSFKPIAIAGDSVYIYHITTEDANRVRHTMGLRQIEQCRPSPEQLLSEMAVAASSSGRIQAAIFAMEGGSQDSVQAVRKAIGYDSRLFLTVLSPEDIRAGKLRNFDVLIVPGGSSVEQGSALGKAGRLAVQEFVKNGGGYVGICAGSILATTTFDWSLRLVNAQTMSGLRYVPGYGMQKASFRGWGTVAVELTREGERLLGHEPSLAQMTYTGGPILSPANEYPLPDYVCLGCFRSEVSKYAFQKEQMIHAPAIVATHFGAGRIILFSPHPDTSQGLESWLIRSIRACARPK
jgi:glutamine amidotransferase-like uncharacterized protein